MVKRSPHGLAVAVVASTFIVVAAGAAVTSSPELASFRNWHIGAAVVAGLLTVNLAARLWSTYKRLAMALIGFVLLLAVPVGELASFRVLHACAAHALFCLAWAACVVTSTRWTEGPQIVQDAGAPSLKSLSLLGAGITGLQALLGAAFRHGMLGVVPHVVGAILTTVVLLILGTFVITQFPKHQPLIRAAWHVIGIVAVQVGLGVLAFIARLNHPEGGVSSAGLITSTVAHVSFGALTLSATVALAMQVQYHVRRRAAIESGLPVAS